ncbi:MAG: FMN-binding negative transcriptional regulator [Phenylobacterium sp.]|uniref:FMN-binding negative transcriptional regulator n=1 Tax=Phenylobacterium sp. TaxID=1871053 RepID=UPI002725EF8E|nr:FMN-binding negative transcriptional regulator [Phenylobacterium sp.]MDO8912223.1 FMN-binding negative transcriptional regulator [Phenylobacterium sp.]MDP3100208.1 FMN-binding negative transcriptional regulator [Phenylobacterium sp.]
MHPALPFRVSDEAVLLDHLAGFPFSTIAASVDGRAVVAHAPVIARRMAEGLVLDFHLSRGNALSPALAEGFHAVAVSLATEAYVSPDWYENRDSVPTWNYVSVEVEGPVTALDEAGLVALLDDLSALEEARLLPKKPWTRNKMSPGKFEGMLKGIVGARMTVMRLQGVTKLSQNKSEADRDGVMTALGDHPIARRMRDLG